eukprot:CAMPEP_0197663972 /NCGR_PEP_ID=MMETSP1338-20131121/58353_1 /TAXON_ID=43686 ORGANISM="Pelagodinium beii, Strain RCC1491" /NCGR_SAMPLE_ID=MMETSP1338 /ASSEMBLY_ACC=CAM_ASM_000754 /LENGTH=120 /DNA_ID=CAMNT_0043242513 /DNA_START=22 /DNA_END=384 /DNA_ORIENTATION=-
MADDKKPKEEEKPSELKQVKQAKVIKAKTVDGEEVELVDEEVISSIAAKAKARKKARQKKMKFQFMFKSCVFVLMLSVVMITKKFNEWYNPEGSKANVTDKTPEVSPITGKPVGQKEGEL